MGQEALSASAVLDRDGPAPSADPPAGGKLTWEEVGLFSQSLTAARGQFSAATKRIASEFGLGPRGPWIVGIIGRAPVPPHALAEVFGVGRSLITSELNRLVHAGLVEQARDPADRRRSTLALTVAGEAVRARLGEALAGLLENRLAGHSRDDILRCARLLSDFAQGPR